MGEYEFKECSVCAPKPGCPVLCESCLHNRDMIASLKTALRILTADVEESIALIDCPPGHINLSTVAFVVRNLKRALKEITEAT